MYYEGKGLPQSYADAYAWWIVSAANGNEKARESMEILQKKLTSSQIEQGQKLAKEIWERIQN
jgi:TPR repeat protein